jgi:transporter family protein
MPRWLLFSLLTMLLWGGWGVLSKPLSTSLSAWQVQALSTFGLLPVLAMLAASPQRKVGSNRRLGFGLALAAGVVSSAGNVACYQALAAGGKAAAVIPITALYPLVTIVLALVFLGERLNGIQMAGLVLAVLALACFNFGADSSLLSPWLAIALVPIGLWGVSALLQKVSTFHASTPLATLAFLLGFVPVALAAPLFDTIHWSLSGAIWLQLVLLGLFFSLGNLTLIYAYSTGGQAAVVTPLASLYSVVTIPLAVTFLHERVTTREGVGIALALLAVVALSWEKRSPPGIDL